MKWVALAFFISTGLFLATWLRSAPRLAPLAWGLLGFLPFVLTPWHLLIAPYSTPGWSGYVKGWEVSLLDFVALGILFGTQGKGPRWALLLPFLLYLFSAILALSQAAYFNLALSYPIQLVRALLIFMAVSRVVASQKGEQAVLTGLICGLSLQAAYAVLDRAGGALQTGGSLGHQNLLGFSAHLVLAPALAMLLAGRWPKAALVGVIAGLLAVTLTASRATIGLSAAALVATLVLSITLRFSVRKALFGVIGLTLLASAIPLAQASLQARFNDGNANFFEEDTERLAFKRAAHSMLAARPLGVGPNHYVFIANTEGYSDRAGVAWRTASRSTNVHNSYLLIAAETGYFGLATFLLLLGCAIWSAFSTAVRFRLQQSSEVLIGCGFGMMAMAVHGLYEWMFVVNPTQYLFAVTLGLISGLQRRFRNASQDVAGPRERQDPAFAASSLPAQHNRYLN